MKAGVIGHPISHSKSPLIHGHWLAQHKIEGTYDAIDIAPENLARDVRRLIDDGYAGFNVTVPHKVAIMDLCDRLDETARIIGAVNTVVIRQGKLTGKNTDAYGFIENLKVTLPDHAFAKPARVLGAGGAARAIIYALLLEGVPHVYLSNRSADKAEALRDLNPERITIVPWEARSDFSDEGLLVNTTSLGMKNQPALDMDLTTLPVDAAVYDIVYAPLMTDLLKAAQARGNPIVTGIGMLLHQARPAFQAWTGVMPDVDAILESRVLA